VYNDSSMTDNWDSIYRQYGSWLQEPHEDMPQVVAYFLQNGVKNVLDIGCGAGRHVIYLAGHGFWVSGLDSSDEAMKMNRDALKKMNLKTELVVASMYEKLPYPDKNFDAIVCTKALNHNTLENIRGAIKEMERVLRPGGIIFIVVTKSRKILPNKKQKREAEIIAERTLIPKTGREIGVIHFQFNKEILLREFRHFRVIDYHIDSSRNYCLVGILK
jgi:ubiquinone/menaquinone biosynthesis C-methylase UbiE